MKNQINEPKRSFGGKLSNFDNKKEEAFEKKHLKAYLRGWDSFRHGYTNTVNSITNAQGPRVPLWFHTKEIWT